MVHYLALLPARVNNRHESPIDKLALHVIPLLLQPAACLGGRVEMAYLQKVSSSTDTRSCCQAYHYQCSEGFGGRLQPCHHPGVFRKVVFLTLTTWRVVIPQNTSVRQHLSQGEIRITSSQAGFWDGRKLRELVEGPSLEPTCHFLGRKVRMLLAFLNTQWARKGWGP